VGSRAEETQNQISAVEDLAQDPVLVDLLRMPEIDRAMTKGRS